MRALQKNLSSEDGALDGSAAQMEKALRSLAELAGGEETHGMPVLRLQFDQILTLTSLAADNGLPCLSIATFLPRSEQFEYQQSPSDRPSWVTAQNNDCLWDVDVGRYVFIRRIPVSEFADERGVLDTIMTCADQAALWLASVGDGKAAG